MHALDALRDAVSRHLSRSPDSGPCLTGIDGVVLMRAQAERHPTHLVHQPAICMVLQGAKWTAFGEQRQEYRAGQARIVNVTVPGSSQVVEGDNHAPYLSLVVVFDQAILSEVYEKLAGVITPCTGAPVPAFAIDLNAQLLDCARRIVDLLDQPLAADILFPGLMRELCYLLLSGPRGDVLAGQIVSTQRNQKLMQVLQALRVRYAQSQSLEALADMAGMSISAFHRSFKALTGMTPLDYQKKVRLMEARRLMITERVSAEATAYAVGYASASQFSRDYARMFGLPPRQDINKLTGISQHV
ncbi:AraC family transcriptional regulator N-terminal domain-containing protein [Pseudomonas sp. B22129]|uniref:AraC family transcriptional regulator n=1 Tax=Pseudomonas sp. B22129 TaxID=3235111 RepID=UPI0037842F36